MLKVFPIKTAADYQKALFILENESVDTPELQIDFEILAQLVEYYEMVHFAPLKKPSPQDSLREIMFLKRLNQGDIAEILGTSQANVSAMLSGKRKINSIHAKKLCEYFDLDRDTFGDVKSARFVSTKKKYSVVKKLDRHIEKRV